MLLMKLKIKFHPMAIYILYFREPKDINNHNNKNKEESPLHTSYLLTYLDFYNNQLSKCLQMENELFLIMGKISLLKLNREVKDLLLIEFN